jgi:hypothetical protein
MMMMMMMIKNCVLCAIWHIKEKHTRRTKKLMCMPQNSNVSTQIVNREYNKHKLARFLFSSSSSTSFLFELARINMDRA